MTKVLCLEGITGAGKTTQAKKIDSYLELQDKKYLIINEKNYEPFKSVIIDWHKKRAHQNFSIEEIKKIANARLETHRKNFSLLLNKIDYLLFDRCFYTSGVYQANDELNPNKIIEMNIRKGIIKPERGIVLICSPEIALERVEVRRKQKNDYLLPSMNETLEEITKRRKLYIQLAKQHPELYLIDTTNKSEDEVFEEVKFGLGLGK